MKKKIRIIFLLIALLIGSGQFIKAQIKNKPKKQKIELIGYLCSDVSSQSGNVRSVAITIGDGGSGQYKAIMTSDETLTTHTIFRPKDLRPFGNKNKLPIVVFANGGCRNSSGEFRNFLSEIASHGFLVISIGPIGNTLLGGSEVAGGGTSSKQLLDAIDWAKSENNRIESPYYQLVETERIAAIGQSCGGLQAIEASFDSRITTTIILNSGLFALPPGSLPNASVKETPANPKQESAKPVMTLPSISKSDLKNLHGPIAYFTGGDSDMASKNAADDFSKIDQLPVIHASYDFSDKVKEYNYGGFGHYPATYRDPNGGDFAIAGVAWLKWQLKGDKKAAMMFVGEPCGLVKNPKWKIAKKKID